MRILHTADWHLGKMLEDRDRREEQEGFVEELCGICRTEKIDLVLLAGDVFQTPNPGAAAQDLFFDAMDQLSEHGRRAVVVIAGNHDSPERLAAPSPLADKLGITLVGYPYDLLLPTPTALPGRVSRVSAGASWLEVSVPGVDHSAVIAALPYPSEGRLKKLLSATTEEADLHRGYNECLGEILGQLRGHYRRNAVNLLMSHLYVRNCVESDHETRAGHSDGRRLCGRPVGAGYRRAVCGAGPPA